MKNKKRNIIIAAALVLGAVYFYSKRKNKAAGKTATFERDGQYTPEPYTPSPYMPKFDPYAPGPSGECPPGTRTISSFGGRVICFPESVS